MSKKDENIVEERVFNVPLTAVWPTLRRRSPRALRALKTFVGKQMKTENIAISNEINELFWQRGIEGAPRHIRVRAAKGKDDKVTIYLVKVE